MRALFPAQTQAGHVKKLRLGIGRAAIGRYLGILGLTLIGTLVASEATAQSCSQMSRTVSQIERNRDFRNLERNKQTASTLERDLGIVERAFVRAGCQRALNAGQSLNRECRNAARQITRGRRDLETLRRLVESGTSLARQRLQLLQRIDGGNCGTQTRQPNLLEQLFNSLSGNNTIVDEGQFQTQYNTVRSVCVRKSDGYYWPVSFATVAQYLPNDRLQCQRQCPGGDVDLYYYSNPGQEPKDMVNLEGQAYTALPNAFQYRETYSRDNSCNSQKSTGTIELVQVNGQSRAFAQIDTLRIPLPLRDPRRKTETIVAEVVHVPLPRPRPKPLDADSARTQPVLSADTREVEINGRVVRIVGPTTPYAQSGAEGT